MKSSYNIPNDVLEKIKAMSYEERVRRAVKVIKKGEKEKMQCVHVMGYLVDGCAKSERPKNDAQKMPLLFEDSNDEERGKARAQ